MLITRVKLFSCHFLCISLGLVIGISVICFPVMCKRIDMLNIRSLCIDICTEKSRLDETPNFNPLYPHLHSFHC